MVRFLNDKGPSLAANPSVSPCCSLQSSDGCAEAARSARLQRADELLVLHMPQRSGLPWLVAEEGAGDLEGEAIVSLEVVEVHLAEVCMTQQYSDASSQEG